MEIRLGFVNSTSTIRPCAFQKPICPNPGPFVDLSFFVIHNLIVQTNASTEITIIPLQSYHNDGKTSMIGGLIANEIDLTPPYMALKHDRALLTPYLYLFYQTNFMFVYKTVTRVPPNLYLFTASQWYVWAFALAMLVATCLFKQARKVFCLNNKTYEKYLTRQNLILAFFFGVFLRYISTQLVILFAEMDKLKEPFTNAEELVEKLEKKEYRAIVHYQNAIDELINPIRHKDKSNLYNRFIKAHESNPELKVTTMDEGMKLILSSDKNYVLITTSGFMSYIRSKYCNISFQVDNILPLQWGTMYRNIHIQLDLKPGAGPLLKEEMYRVFKRYFPVALCPHELMQPDHFEIKPLGMDQMQSIFWVLIIVSGLGFFILFLETVKKKVDS